MRNLLGRLLDQTTSELAAIAEFWDVPLTRRDRFDNVAAVYRTMTDLWAARDVWERLSPTERAVVVAYDTLASAPAAANDIAWIVGEAPDVLVAELTLLERAGILSEDDDQAEVEISQRLLFLSREMRLIFQRVREEQENPASPAADLHELISALPVNDLEEAASIWGARVTPGIYARGELAKIVQDHLTRPDRIERQVTKLSPAVRAAWTRLRESGGSMALDELLPVGRQGLEARRRILRELGDPLLVWHGYPPDDEGQPRRFLFIPQAVLHPVVPEPPAIPDLKLVPANEIIEPEWLFPMAAVWDVVTLLRETVTSKPRWTPLVEEDPAILRRFGRRLWRADPETGDLPTGYLAFLVQVGALLGALQNDDHQAVLGRDARTWFSQPFSRAARRMIQVWSEAESWFEGSSRVDLVLYGASWPAFRASLLQAIGGLEPGAWYDQAQFIERLIRSEPTLLGQARVGSVASSQLSMRLDQPVEIEARRAQILSLVIGTTLETAGVWLGLIERSHTVTGHHPVFRLTPLGAWLAGKGPEPELVRLGPASLSVGANFQVLLYRPDPRRVWALSAFAEQRTLDQVSIWELTAAALIRALAGGVDLEEIIQFLERQSGEPLPQVVAYTLAEWDRGYRRVWLRRSIVLTPEEGEDVGRISEALVDAGLDPVALPDGRLLLSYDEPDVGEQLFGAVSRTLRERGFAPLDGPEEMKRETRQ
jgi:hypothetical protein